MSCRRSASTQPSAEVMPGKRGTSAHFRPISRISAPTCSAPPPPNGIATKRAGSWPRSIETRRIAPAMRASATRTIAAAAAVGVEAERRADMRRDGALGGLDIERLQLAAERARRVDAAEHDLGIGQRRPRVALAVADRPGHRARAFRADLQEAAAIDRGDRAAARADGRDLDHRRADDQAEVDGGLRRDRDLAARDHRDVERRAAEIAGDEIVEARGLGDAPRPRPRRRPGRTGRCARAACARSRST